MSHPYRDAAERGDPPGPRWGLTALLRLRLRLDPYLRERLAARRRDRAASRERRLLRLLLEDVGPPELLLQTVLEVRWERRAGGVFPVLRSPRPAPPPVKVSG